MLTVLENLKILFEMKQGNWEENEVMQRTTTIFKALKDMVDNYKLHLGDRPHIREIFSNQEVEQEVEQEVPIEAIRLLQEFELVLLMTLTVLRDHLRTVPVLKAILTGLGASAENYQQQMQIRDGRDYHTNYFLASCQSLLHWDDSQVINRNSYVAWGHDYYTEMCFPRKTYAYGFHISIYHFFEKILSQQVPLLFRHDDPRDFIQSDLRDKIFGKDAPDNFEQLLRHFFIIAFKADTKPVGNNQHKALVSALHHTCQSIRETIDRNWACNNLYKKILNLGAVDSEAKILEGFLLLAIQLNLEPLEGDHPDNCTMCFNFHRDHRIEKTFSLWKALFENKVCSLTCPDDASLWETLIIKNYCNQLKLLREAGLLTTAVIRSQIEEDQTALGSVVTRF